LVAPQCTTLAAAFYVLADSGKLGVIASYWVVPIDALMASGA
jgi:hypothetical protein